MSEVADRYRRLSGEFIDKVSQVSPDRWSASSPCEGWTARDVVAHVADAHGIFFGLVGWPFERTVNVDDDAVGALRQVIAQTQAELDDPARASAMFEGFFGPMSFEGAVDRFVCFDLVVHNWDLSRATGLDETLDADDVARVNELALGFGDSMRSPKAFGPEVQTTKTDPQSRLLAYLGRTP